MTGLDFECVRCGQVRIERSQWAVMIAGRFVCEPCRELDREPQGEAVRLFEPAPTPVRGQLALSVVDVESSLPPTLTLPERRRQRAAQKGA